MASRPEAQTSATTPPTTISLRAPTKYLHSASMSESSTTNDTRFAPPPLDWLSGTWSVTHSTLPMWRSARNVRITYKPLPSSSQSTVCVDDLVEYEKKGLSGTLKSIEGVDRPDPTVLGAWDWRGKGWLKFVSSHWELLGWGERPLLRTAGGGVGEMGEGVERWAVTWFAPTIFSKEGIDIYSDRKEGLSSETLEGIMKALKALDASKVVELVDTHMQEVEIQLPWKEKS